MAPDIEIMVPDALRRREMIRNMGITYYRFRVISDFGGISNNNFLFSD